jgi:hypothetical protein
MLRVSEIRIFGESWTSSRLVLGLHEIEDVRSKPAPKMTQFKVTYRCRFENTSIGSFHGCIGMKKLKVAKIRAFRNT